jgi:hypothetical protein
VVSCGLHVGSDNLTVFKGLHLCRAPHRQGLSQGNPQVITNVSVLSNVSHSHVSSEPVT